MNGKLNLSQFEWINPPGEFSIENNLLIMITDPETDYWQRTYYGFSNDNGHAFVRVTEDNFTFMVKTDFRAVSQYDQCGIILYQDCDNWVKASVEYENKGFALLGSVVTNLGFSDWASTDISSSVNSMWYRLSRRGQDFCLEHSPDGETFLQMRIFHMHLPVTTARIGVYACSPLKPGFKAQFSNFDLGLCMWPEHLGN